MKIEYRHFSEPEKIKTYDTVEAYRKRPSSLTGIEISQSEFDKAELAHFEKDKKNGVILEYKVISNETGGAKQ